MGGLWTKEAFQVIYLNDILDLVNIRVKFAS